MRESNFCLRILEVIKIKQIRKEKLEYLIQDLTELEKIFGSIVNNT